MGPHFHAELESLKGLLLSMASLVEEAIHKSIKALVERDEGLAQGVIASDDAVNMMEIQIDDFCLKLLALHQPAAIDLRFITAALKINNDLERMGDQAVNIAERTLELLQEPLLKPLIDLPHMAELAQKMVKDSLDAFVRKDTELARDVCTRDNQVDALNDQVFRELLTYMMQDPRTITRAVHLLLVGRHLERIADHATNIAEDVIYMVQGKVIKHRFDVRRIDV
ncbi:MAG: phosphate signaling complex protein PhoU [candidate division NC10 bacterium]|nr:phosphate signaling complex protein PhoU [candidate division NC10 bacterium]